MYKGTSRSSNSSPVTTRVVDTNVNLLTTRILNSTLTVQKRDMFEHKHLSYDGRPLPDLHVLVILNPFSGYKKSPKIFKKTVKPFLDTLEISYDLEKTTDSNFEAEIQNKLLKQYYNAIIVLGGDGTVHEVINAMLTHPELCKKPTPILPLPGGSSNSICCSLVLNRFGVRCPKQLTTLMLITFANNLETKHHLVEYTNGDIFRYISLIVCTGIMANVSATTQNNRFLPPALRGIYGAVRELLSHKPLPKQTVLKFRSNEIMEEISDEFMCISVNLGPNVSKDLYLAPTTRMGDGELFIMVMKKKSRLETIKSFIQAMSGKHIDFFGNTRTKKIY